MKKNLYCGLDIATTMGVALWEPESHVALVTEVKGSPVEQYVYIYNNIILTNRKESYIERWVQVEDINKIVFTLEQLAYFRNAKTTRSLLERLGYIKYSLLSVGQEVNEVTATVARRSFGVIKKHPIMKIFQDRTDMKLTDNHTDALALVIHQSVQDRYKFDIEKITIKELET
jgi:hypothetical protein